MSMWEEFDFEPRILGILRDDAGPDHHMGPAFLSPYQIAIEFARRHPADFQQLQRRGFPIGGKEPACKTRCRSTLPKSYRAG